jgi:hypothetical protein
VPGQTRIDREDLEANFPPKHVAGVFCDDHTGKPGPRLQAACSRASRRAEGHPAPRVDCPSRSTCSTQEDEAIVAETCRLAMAYGVEGKTEWTGPRSSPTKGLEQAALKALKDLADAEQRSRGEAAGAGANPRASGSMSSPDPTRQYVFTPSRNYPRRGGY